MSRNNNNNNGVPTADRRGLGAGAEGPSGHPQGPGPDVVAQQFAGLQQQIQQQAQVQAQMMAQLQAITAHLQQTRSSTVPSTTRSTGPPTTSIDTPPTDRPRASEQEKEVGKLLRASIGKFSGKDRRPHTLLNFLAQFEEYVGFMRLAGREKSAAFSAMLAEDAAVWYRALDRTYTWTDLKEESLRRFRDPRAEQNARSKLHQLEQVGSAKNYTEEFKRLCVCIADLTEADKL